MTAARVAAPVRRCRSAARRHAAAATAPSSKQHANLGDSTDRAGRAGRPPRHRPRCSPRDRCRGRASAWLLPMMMTMMMMTVGDSTDGVGRTRVPCAPVRPRPRRGAEGIARTGATGRSAAAAAMILRRCSTVMVAIVVVGDSAIDEEARRERLRGPLRNRRCRCGARRPERAMDRPLRRPRDHGGRTIASAATRSRPRAPIVALRDRPMPALDRSMSDRTHLAHTHLRPCIGPVHRVAASQPAHCGAPGASRRRRVCTKTRAARPTARMRVLLR